MFLLLSTAILGLLLLISTYWFRWSKKARCIAHLPQSRSYPLIGSTHIFSFRKYGMIAVVCKLWKLYGTVYSIWLGPVLLVGFADPYYIESILSSNTHITKSGFYNFLKSWLGNGLLLSTGGIWKRHRKIITPSFHFKILEEFVDVFNNNCNIMIKNLKKKVDGPSFDIYKNVALCSLDIICETAMDVSVHAQQDSESPYVRAVEDLSDIWLRRVLSPWLFPDFIFRRTSSGKRYNECLEILHGTTKKVISERRDRFQRKLEETTGNNDEENDVGQKKRLAFLDMLLQYARDGANITDQQICDEISTFMFAGYDTTSAAVGFCLWALATHPDIQDKVYDEVETIFGGSDRDLSYRDLQVMSYLECVIKETLRLYPSVPFYGRELTEDANINGLSLAAGTNLMISVYSLHRNSEYFPEPDKFDPSRFESHNTKGRHPYCYLPFSAGPRNCIGQKFAMNEVKIMVSKIIWNYRVIPAAKELTLHSDMVLRSTNGVPIKLENRR